MRSQFLKLPTRGSPLLAEISRSVAAGRGPARKHRSRGQKSPNEPVQAVAVSPTGRSWEEGRRFLELNACNFRRRGSVLLAEISRSVAARRAGAGGSTETARAGAEVRKPSSASRRRFARGASAARGRSILRTQFLRLPTTRIASPRRDLVIRRGGARRGGCLRNLHFRRARAPLE